MTKCRKSGLPECEYFTTGGCVSPFNCSYKAENESITTAISCNLYSLETDKDREISRLKAEVAELRARLNKAVELPCKLGGDVYSVRWSKVNPKDGIVVEECVSRIEVGSSSGFAIHTIEYEPLLSSNIYYNVDWNDTVFATRAEAEARLKELQGGER